MAFQIDVVTVNNIKFYLLLMEVTLKEVTI